MKKFTRAVAIATLAAVPVIGFSSAPAGAKTVPAKQWSTKFCTALSDWLDSIQGSTADLQAAIADTTDLAGSKQTIVDYLNTAIDATDTAIADLKAAGTPKTTNGAKISAAFVSAMGEAKSIFEKAEADAEDLPTDDVTTFSAETSAIGAQISASASKVDAGFSKVSGLDKNNELNDVVAKTRACKFLNSSS
ncbi:MAG: hypothetical protein U0W40_16530 [Acidimicrobiia bacterium]